MKARLRHSVIISNLTTLLVSGNIQDMYKRPKNNTISDDVKDWPPSFIVIIWFIINSALLWGPSKWKSTTFNLISYCCQISGTWLKLWCPGLRRFYDKSRWWPAANILTLSSIYPIYSIYPTNVGRPIFWLYKPFQFSIYPTCRHFEASIYGGGDSFCIFLS